MKKRRRTVFLAVAGLVAIGASFALWHKISPPEPTYQGKPLSYWVETLGVWYHVTEPRWPHGTNEAREAVLRIGPKAVPWLLTWIAYEPPPWRKKLNTFCQKHPFFKRLATDEDEWYRRPLGAMQAFAVLGPAAQGAEPHLLEVLDKCDSVNNGVFSRASGALLSVSPDVVPRLVDDLNSTNAYHRAWCAAVLLHAGWDAIPALPGLMGHLEDPDPDVRYNVEMAVEQLAVTGQSHALPYLQTMLTNGSPTIQGWARALIRPGWLANSPELVPFLVEELNSTNAHYRAWALEALLENGTNALPALPRLLEHAEDPNPEVRFKVFTTANQLAKSGKGQAVPYLQQVLTNRSSVSRTWATSTLRSLPTEWLTNAPPNALGTPR